VINHEYTSVHFTVPIIPLNPGIPSPSQVSGFSGMDGGMEWNGNKLDGFIEFPPSNNDHL